MNSTGDSRQPDRSPAQGEAGPSSDPGATVIAYLLSGPLTFGGLGWALDAWLNTSFFIVVGLLAGLGLAFYLVWIRYGKA